MKGTIVVTRHKALVEYLKEIGLINDDTPIFDHVTHEQVMDKDVIGVLPLSLASDARSVIEVPLNLTKELREKGELDLETIREIAGSPVRYEVKRTGYILPPIKNKS